MKTESFDKLQSDLFDIFLKNEIKKLKDLAKSMEKPTKKEEKWYPNPNNFVIGDIIHDKDSEQTYYEGVITQLNPIKYIIRKVIVDNVAINSKLIGKTIEPTNWYNKKITYKTNGK